jgi:hypothetical protein
MHSPDVAGPTGQSFAKRPFAKGRVAKGRLAKGRLAKGKAAIARRRGTVALGAKASALPPLQWWRHLPADAFTADHLGVLRRAVAAIPRRRSAWRCASWRRFVPSSRSST